ncbi:MAG: transposase [Chitinophagales bacterium]
MILKKFDNYRQLIAYVGLSPRKYESGTSVRGRGHICKMGQSQIRKLLYMCSWSAKKLNKACIAMYERLIAKGKAERVVKIAIANKLLKQAFAIAKNKEVYNENFMQKVCF